MNSTLNIEYCYVYTAVVKKSLESRNYLDPILSHDQDINIEHRALSFRCNLLARRSRDALQK